MQVLTRAETGMCPAPNEISVGCSCPDYTAKRAQNGKASAFSMIPSAISTAAGDALVRTSHGSVNGSNRGLVWGEVDATYPGVISASV